MDANAVLPRASKKPRADDLITGAIIGVVEIVDVVERSTSKWFQGPYGLVLANPRPLTKPIPVNGRLGLWEVPSEIVRQIQRRLI
jgi:hypothetical protein